MDGLPDLGPLIALLQQAGPVGAVMAGTIVALSIALVIVARFGSLWTAVQAVDFQAKLLATVDKLQASEDALRRRVDELGLTRATQQEEIDELHVQLALLRNQRRRLIERLHRASAQRPARGRGGET